MNTPDFKIRAVVTLITFCKVNGGQFFLEQQNCSEEKIFLPLFVYYA